MEFITTGNRIAVENFEIGYFYTINMLSGNYFQACCTGIGSDFVMFSRDEPDLLFSLTMQSAADVSRIELYGGGSGTNDYNDLRNKPQINGITLIGNKSLSDLGIQETISDLDTIRSGAAAGATAVQPAAMSAALAAKQDTLSAAQLAAVNSGIDAAKVAQIETNKNNISLIEQANGSKNVFDISDTYFVSGNVTYTLDSSTSTLNASITNQTYRRIMWNTKLKAGVEYTIMLDVSAIDNPIQIYPTTSDTATSSPWGTIDILATGSYTMNFTATADTTYLALYLAYGTSTTNDVEIENIMIMPKNLKDAGFTDFQPYAMSNAELTAALKAIQIQLANQ